MNNITDYQFTPGLQMAYDKLYRDANEEIQHLTLYAVACAIIMFFPTEAVWAAIVALVPMLPRMVRLSEKPMDYIYEDIGEEELKALCQDYVIKAKNVGIDEDAAQQDLQGLIYCYENADAHGFLACVMALSQKLSAMELLEEEK